MTALALAPVRGRNRFKPAEKATPRFLVNAVQFCAWIAQASPGDTIEYHHGMLAIDASIDGQSSASDARRELARVARIAWRAAEKGLVHLVQRRCGPDDYSYIAVARPRTGKVTASLSAFLLQEVA